MKIQNISTDVLIIGSGGSALFSAYLLAKNCSKLNISIASSFNIGAGATMSAKGGINAALANVTKDKWQWHAFDTIKSGQGLCNEAVVNKTCRIAPLLIKAIDKLGVDFDKDENGKIMQRKYGGQRLDYGKGDFAWRACFKSDTTGASIINALKNKVTEHQNISLHSNLHLVSIDASDKMLNNAIFTNIKDDCLVNFNFKYIIIASGGYSCVYSSATSGGSSSCVPLVLLNTLGADFKDAEFVQFHPTGLYPSNILISEACRAEGAYLETEDGERFLKYYSPENMELSSRDVISKAIFTQMQIDKSDFVYLNLKHIDSNVIKTKLANAYKNAMFFCSKDLTQDRIKIRPVAHYSMGGLAVDENYRLNNFTNAFCVGEAACASLHGANRLGCNSLLELLTSSLYAVFALKKQLRSGSDDSVKLSTNKEFNIIDLCRQKIKELTSGDTIKTLDTKFLINSEIANTIASEVKYLMDKHLGIVKDRAGMTEILKIINNHLSIFVTCDLEVKDVMDFNDIINSLCLLKICKTICLASLKRRESIGSFIRTKREGGEVSQNNEIQDRQVKQKPTAKQPRARMLKQNLQRRKNKK